MAATPGKIRIVGGPDNWEKELPADHGKWPIYHLLQYYMNGSLLWSS